MDRFRKLPSPIGLLTIFENEHGQITSICFEGDRGKPEGYEDLNCAQEASAQLLEYFEGKRVEFKVGLAPKGTEFQKAVWNALLEIPYGQTCSYSSIALRVGRPNAVRAVGTANGSNPIPIIIPCHRVIGADGSLTGYGGGLDIKRRLLEHERVIEPALL